MNQPDTPTLEERRARKFLDDYERDKVELTEPHVASLIREAVAEATDRLESSNAALRDVLRSLEWSSRRHHVSRDTSFSCCPICHEFKHDGKHKPDCRLKAALDGAAAHRRP